jgi:hypothetical protein
MEEGEIEIDSIVPITFGDITPDLARACGFEGVTDLLKVAKHGRGQNVYLVRFRYMPPQRSVVPAPRSHRKTNVKESAHRRRRVPRK